jgi:peptide/nickel transport system substrate-binding protein
MYRGRASSVMRATAGIALLCASLAACGSTQPTSSGAGGGTMVFADASEPSTIDPAIANVDFELHVTRNVYDALTTYSLDDLSKVEPALATSWKADGNTWTFQLRKGVKFQDGQSFSSRDVKASLDRTLKIGQGEAYLIASIKSVQTPDASTVLITTKRPDPFLAANLTRIGIVSVDDVKRHAAGGDLAQKWLQDHANGTGPYSFVNWVKGSQIALKRNTAWWGRFPDHPVEKVVDKFVSDGPTRAQGLQGGTYDFANSLQLDDVLRIADRSGFGKVEGDNLFAWPAIYLNTKAAPLDDPSYREALVKAFDYKAMRDYFKGTAVTPRGPIPNWYPGSPEDQLPEVKQDMPAAKAALSRAGSSARSITCSIPTGFPDFEFAATVLQSSAKQLGVTVKTRLMPFAQAIDAVKKSKVQCFILGNAILSPQDPTAFLDAHYVSGAYYNSELYANHRFDELTAQIAETFSASKRSQMLLEAFKMIMDNHMIIFTARPKTVYAVPDYVKGFEVDGADYTGIRFYELSLDH